ncbi:hypothetical protein ACOMHN_056420 [Nucella lapillus]
MCGCKRRSMFFGAVAATQGAVTPHIIGGVEAEYGEHPYICSLQNLYSGQWHHVCGSVIWNKDYMVTAAHCVDWNGRFRVVCGQHRLGRTDQHQVTHSVSSKLLHPRYGDGSATFANDIAVLKLSSSLEFTSHVKSYRFADENDGNFAGKQCILSGWGLKDDGKLANTLKKVEMLTITNKACQNKWDTYSGVISPGHVCFLEDTKSSCNGDSGGPVRCNDVITGITSWGVSNCDSAWPSVYTRVSTFNSWLKGHAVAATQGAVTPHIIGGVEAEYGEHPYICSLQNLYSGQWHHVCGSVIWNKDYMVTAAHCVDWNGRFRVVCGQHRLGRTDQHQVTHSVSSKLLHPHYGDGSATFANDIAVLKLSSSLEFTSHVKSYRFADENDGNFAGKQCILSGWGLKDDGKLANTLKKVEMLTITNMACQKKWDTYSGVISPGHVCFLEDTKSSCNGDSGGPVRCNDVITGITSWGVSNCDSAWPSVYTRVSTFNSWLKGHAGQQEL